MDFFHVTDKDAHAILIDMQSSDELFGWVWAHKATRQRVFSHLAEHLSTENDKIANIVLEKLARRFRTPEDIEISCNAVPHKYKNNFLWALVNTGNIGKSIFYAFLEDEIILKRIDPDHLLISDILWHRFSFMIETSPNRSYTIEEIVPKHLPKDIWTRPVLGAALDAGRLKVSAIHLLRESFPNDKYIQMKTTELLKNCSR